MKRNIINKYWILFLAILFTSSIWAQTDTINMEEILVTGKQEDKLLQTNISAETIKLQDVHDVGEMFKNQPGFGVAKRGNYAMEPVLRGFKYEQFNVQIDGGTKSSNACPNRMDPAISQVSPEEVEKAEVIKGPYQVRFGPALGGLINIVTRRPEKVNEFKVKGAIEGGYMHHHSFLLFQIWVCCESWKQPWKEQAKPHSTDLASGICQRYRPCWFADGCRF